MQYTTGRAAQALLVAALLALGGCGRKEQTGTAVSRQASEQATEKAMAAARDACASANIVIVCLDAARRDHLGCYGYSRPTTPEIDKLAAEGLRFENPVTDATYTLAAIGSLWSGQYPDTHGLWAIGKRLPLELTTLPEACRAAGMRTAVLSSNGNVIPSHGFADGVDHFETILAGKANQGSVPDLEQAWRRWLDEIGSQRFFLYVHLMPPHHPYEWSGPFRGKFDPDYQSAVGSTEKLLFDLDAGAKRVSERDREHLIAMYDEALRYADWAVGRLVEDLRKRGLLDRTLLLIFSDHGEGFGEHGRWLHSYTVYNELTHNFLVMRLPAGVSGARKVVPGLAQLSDVAPTLASLSGLKFPSGQLQGHNLVTEIFGGPVAREVAFSRDAEGRRPRRSVEISRAKGVFDGFGKLLELFDLTSDSGEKKNLAGKRYARTLEARVKTAWQAWAQRQKHIRLPASFASKQNQGLDSKTKKWLRSLGYL